MNLPIPDLPEGPSLETVRGPVEIPLLEAWQWAVAVSLAVAFILLAGLWLVRFLKRTFASAASPAPPPKRAALATLSRAAERKDGPGFASLCAEALRDYCRHAHRAGSPSDATAEFVMNATGCGRFPAPALAELELLLDRCDQFKFAREAVTDEERAEIVARARAWIEARETDRARPDDKPAAATTS